MVSGKLVVAGLERGPSGGEVGPRRDGEKPEEKRDRADQRDGPRAGAATRSKGRTVLDGHRRAGRLAVILGAAMMRASRVPPQAARRATDDEAMLPRYWSEAVAHLSDRDPVLARIIAAYPSERLVARDDPFGTLARSIVGQQISVKAASSVWERIERTLGAVTATRIAAADEETLRGCGLSRSKLLYLGDLADKFLSGAIEPARWAEADDEAVVAELTRVKGVGRWTAEMFLIFHLLRPDVLPLADIGLQRAVARHYADDVRPDAKEITHIARSWRPWRSVATWYLWRSLDPLPVSY